MLLENRVSRGLPVPQKLFHPNVDRLEVTKKCRINTSMPAAACLENLVKHTLPDYIAVKYNLLSKSMEGVNPIKVSQKSCLIIEFFR